MHEDDERGFPPSLDGFASTWYPPVLGPEQSEAKGIRR